MRLRSAWLVDVRSAGWCAFRGARRLNEAIKWLPERYYVTVEVVLGHPNRVFLLEESGADPPYAVPGEADNRLLTARQTQRPWLRKRYVQLPTQFWTSGWMACCLRPPWRCSWCCCASRCARA